MCLHVQSPHYVGCFGTGFGSTASLDRAPRAQSGNRINGGKKPKLPQDLREFWAAAAYLGCANQRFYCIVKSFVAFLRNIRATLTTPNTASNSALPPEVSGTSSNDALAEVVATTTAAIINRYKLNFLPTDNVASCMSPPSMNTLIPNSWGALLDANPIQSLVHT